jgi:DNA-binding beta-propeller fold protein YncE
MSCGFLYDDKALTATVTASSGTLGDGGVDKLLDPQPRHRMRLSGSTAHFVMDLGAIYSLDCFALISTNITDAGSARVRVSDTDAAAVSSLTHDSGVMNGCTDDEWMGQVIQVLTSPINGRYLRWDLTIGSGASIDIGLAPVGLLWRPQRNYAYGANRGRQDYSVREGNSRTGTNFPVRGSSARVQAFQLTAMTPAEADGDMRNMDSRVGVAGDVLWIPEATDVILTRAKDCIWGAFKQVGTPTLIVHDSFQIHSRAFQMVERL